MSLWGPNSREQLRGPPWCSHMLCQFLGTEKHGMEFFQQLATERTNWLTHEICPLMFR
jgi:hypothetical protein